MNWLSGMKRSKRCQQPSGLLRLVLLLTLCSFCLPAYAQPGKTKLLEDFHFEVTEVTKRAEGGWIGKLAAGSRAGIQAGSSGNLIHGGIVLILTSPDKTDVDLIYTLATETGTCRVTSVEADSAVVEIASTRTGQDAPQKKDFCALPIQIPAETYEGIVLQLAASHIGLTSADGSVSFTDLAAALQLRSEADEKALWKKMMAALSPPPPGNTPIHKKLERPIEKGRYAGRMFAEVTTQITSVEFEDFLRALVEEKRNYAGHTFTVTESLMGWVLFNGAAISRSSVERHAQMAASDVELVAYLKEVATRDPHFIWQLDYWSDEALEAAQQKDEPKVHLLARLFRCAEQATGTKAYGAAARLAEGVLLTSQDNIAPGLEALKQAASLADTLPEDAADEKDKVSGSDIAKPYWKARALRYLAQAQAKLPDYVAAANSAEQALKLLFASPPAGHRLSEAAWVYFESATYFQQVGEYNLAEKRYKESIAALLQRQLPDSERRAIALQDPLAELASAQGDYNKAIELRTGAIQKAEESGFTEMANSLRWNLGADYWRAGDYEKAQAQFEKVFPFYQATPEQQARLLEIGRVLASRGRFEQAAQRLREAAAVAEKSKLPVRMATVEEAQADVLAQQQSFPEAIALYQRAVQRVDAASNGRELAQLYADFAEVLQSAKRVDEAEGAFRKAIELYGKHGFLAYRNRQWRGLAELYRATGRPEEAEKILNELVKVQQEAGDRNGLAWTLASLASLHLHSAFRPDQARQEAERALQLANEVRDERARAFARSVLASCLAFVGDETASLKIYEDDIEEAQARGDSFRVAELTVSLADVARAMEKNDLATQRYQQALEFFRARQMNGWTAQTLLALASFELSNGNVKAARERMQEVEKVLGSNPSDESRAAFLHYMGVILRREGDFKQAVERLTQAGKLFEKTSNRAGQLLVLEQLGRVQASQRELPAALETWKSILRQSEGYVAFQVQAHANLAETLAGMGEYKEAEKSARESIRLADALTLSPAASIETRANWALLLLERARKSSDLAEAGRYADEATGLLNEAEALAQQKGVRATEPDIRLGRAWRIVLLALRENKLPVSVQPVPVPADEASAFDAAVDSARRYFRPEWEALYLRGVWRNRVQRDADGAITDLRLSIEQLERQAQNYAIAAGRTSSSSLFQADQLRPFLFLVDLYAEKGSAAENQVQNLRAKKLEAEAAAAQRSAEEFYAAARVVLDRLRRFEILTTAGEAARASDAEPLQRATAEYQLLIRHEMELEQRIAEEAKKGREAVVNTLQEKLKQQQEQVRIQADLIRKQYPDLASRLELDTKDLNKFAARLAPDEALLQPVLLPGRLVVFVARNQKGRVSIRAFNHDVNEEEFKSEMEQLWQAASNPRSVLSPETADQPDSAARIAARLYDRLFAPAEPALEGIHTVLISATGKMRYVPFHLLLARCADGARRYVSDLYDIFYLTRSGAIDNYSERSNYAGAPLVAVANPDGTLPEADQEIDEVEATWKGASPAASMLVKRRQEASVGAVEAALRKVAAGEEPRKGIFHLATHGKAGTLASESYLVFADGRVSQEKLRSTFDDLSGVSMVVLSACETALGSLDERGTGVTGLAYEFEDGGAHTVVATLWKLDSRSGLRFMDVFYKRLAEGAPVSQALREGRRAIRDDPNTSHPYYWAPFILIGQWR
jgi:CHAT domain-containing protein/tetratricopeptide (TPR) repeat protein